MTFYGSEVGPSNFRLGTLPLIEFFYHELTHLEMVRSHLVVGYEISSVDNLVERSHNSQETTNQKSFTGHFTGTPVNPLWWVRVEFTLDIYS